MDATCRDESVVSEVPVWTAKTPMSCGTFHLNPRTPKHRDPQEREQDWSSQRTVDELSDSPTTRYLGNEGTHKRRPGDPPGPVEHRPLVHPLTLPVRGRVHSVQSNALIYCDFQGEEKSMVY